MCPFRTPLLRRSLTCLVQDQTLALRLQQVVQLLARTLLCLRDLPRLQHLKLVARPLVVCKQVEVLLVAVQLEKETRLLS